MIGWGFTPIWVRLLGDVATMGIIAGRLAFALPFAFGTLLLFGARPALADLYGNRRAWLYSLCLVVNYGCTVTAVQLAPVAEAALFLNTSPLFALLIGFMIGSRPRRRQIVGAGIAVTGLVLSIWPGLTLSSTASFGATRMIGDGLALLGASMMALYSTLHSRSGGETDSPTPVAVSVCAFTVGIFLMAGWIATGGSLPSLFPHVSGTALILALAVFSTAIPTVMFTMASVELPPVTVHTFRLLTPLIAAAAAFFILDEVPTAWLLPGGALVLGGLWIITTTRDGS